MAALFRKIARLAQGRALEPHRISVADEEFAVHFRRNARSRRLVLRLNAEATAVILTVPHGVSRGQAIDFVERSTDWIAEKLGRRGDAIKLIPGARIPLRGAWHEIRHIPSLRGTVTADPVNAILHVPGGISHMGRRLTDWLKAAARADLIRASDRYAGLMGVSYRRISVRDQRSRWGSCSASGDLSFSWRLILAPCHVLDYVAAHEVAHLAHMNHGPAFWRLVLTHCADAKKAKHWLKTQGQSVHRVMA